LKHNLNNNSGGTVIPSGITEVASCHSATVPARSPYIMASEGFLKIRRGLSEHLDRGKMSGKEYLLYLHLLIEADHRTGVVWKTSAPFIQHNLECFSLRQLREAIHNLEVKGYLKRFFSYGKNTFYDILLDKYEIVGGSQTVSQKTISINDVQYEARSQALPEPTLELQPQPQLTTRRKERRTKNKKEYALDSFEYLFAKDIFTLLAEPHGAKQPNLQKWADKVRLMKESDKRTEEYLRDTLTAVLEYEGSGGFTWKANIRSVDKFRSKMDEGKINPYLVKAKEDTGIRGEVF